jgi:hypothetical protein
MGEFVHEARTFPLRRKRITKFYGLHIVVKFNLSEPAQPGTCLVKIVILFGEAESQQVFAASRPEER